MHMLRNPLKSNYLSILREPAARLTALSLRRAPGKSFNRPRLACLREAKSVIWPVPSSAECNSVTWKIKSFSCLSSTKEKSSEGIRRRQFSVNASSESNLIAYHAVNGEEVSAICVAFRASLCPSRRVFHSILFLRFSFFE